MEIRIIESPAEAMAEQVKNLFRLLLLDSIVKKCVFKIRRLRRLRAYQRQNEGQN
jgi:hypothetical protein